MQLFLKVRHRDHQVCPVLAHIADLKRSRIGELVLHGEIPLLRDCRLNVRIPQANECILKWISRRQQTLFGGGCRQIAIVIVRFKLRAGKRRVHGEPEIGACTLQIRGDRVGATEYGLSAEE